MTLNLDGIRQRAYLATPAPWLRHGVIVRGPCTVTGRDGDLCCVSFVRHARPRAELDADFIAHARTDVPALCDEVERLKAENAKLREVAQRVVSDFPPYQEIEHVDNGPDDPKEVPTGELLCGSCAQGLDDHDAHCLYAMAERALANGGAASEEDGNATA